MKATIILELQAEILECAKSFGETSKTTRKMADHFFNKELYIIEVGDPEDWLNSHGVSSWEAIAIVAKWTKKYFDTPIPTKNLNPAKIVEELCYIASESLFDEYLEKFKTAQELAVYLESELGSGD